MKRTFDVTTSLLATLARWGHGAAVGRLGARPAKPLELYEFEACPFCRKAREALSVLDLDAMIYPCPRGGPRFRAEVERRGGKQQFPYLVDANAGVEMYESDDIVRHLWQRYGTGGAPLVLSLGPLTDASAMLASAARLGAGASYRRA
ncbi:MAG: glutathione S-transferase N-terminal domain-containing protein, partial [Burkholderiales bacterium]